MPVSREEVYHSFVLLLGREPESEFAIQEKMRNYHSLRGLVESLTLSDEFKQRRLLEEHSALNGDSSVLIEQVKNSSDEIYGKIKPYLVP